VVERYAANVEVQKSTASQKMVISNKARAICRLGSQKGPQFGKHLQADLEIILNGLIIWVLLSGRAGRGLRTITLTE
jgi:hypothetical protein